MTLTIRGIAWLLAVMAPLAAAAQSDLCRISRLAEAPVSVERNGTATDAVLGQILEPGDVLRVGAGGQTTIACAGDLTVALGPDTVFELDEVLPDGRSQGVGLLRGIAGFLFRRGGQGTLEVRTPSAVAAVRSTEWAMEVTGGGTAVFVREGSVEVRADRTVTLRAGEGIDVSATGAAGAVDAWRSDRIARLADLLGPDWETGQSP